MGRAAADFNPAVGSSRNRTIISINFVPLMSLVAIVSTFAYRRTGHHLPRALISAAFVAWYMVVGQATQVP